MQDHTRLDRLWSRLVWPVLWPVLLAQGALVVLCLVVAGMLGSMVPSYASWRATFGLLLALLVGSSLNGVVFLALLKPRLRRMQREVDDALASIEGWLARHQCSISAEAVPLPRRLAALSEVCESLLEGWKRELEVRRSTEQRLVGDLQARRDQLERLEAGRMRAREESRLKSGYLCHLQQSLAPLMSTLSEVLESETLRQCRGAREHATLLMLREHLADAVVLLENLDESRATSVTSLPLVSGKGRVLIVDDGPVNLILARQVLERQGFDVETATSGEQALSRRKGAPFDLVLMDIFMPGMDGMETSRHWREREAEDAAGRHSILVALTANASDEDCQRFRQAGMDDYLTKPYRPRALVDMVQRWLMGTSEQRPA
ncbi:MULTISPECIES: response regulator [Halomonas]|uniref:CheY-like chemotaxis protein n=1 Tax=Halomonas ventosae TaxID=229007 RepID=A0A4V3BYQ5_9GAMM|nr:response regulator [Halomonas ventosae]TDO03499.1 CheY-like chemotaxis protein [Halomonas ventosae]